MSKKLMKYKLESSMPSILGEEKYKKTRSILMEVFETHGKTLGEIMINPKLEIPFKLDGFIQLEMHESFLSTIASFGAQATQLPSFERLPLEVRTHITGKASFIEKKKQLQETKIPKFRKRLFEKTQKTTNKININKITSWIVIYYFLVHLLDIHPEPAIKHNAPIMVEYLTPYIRYLFELLDSIKYN